MGPKLWYPTVRVRVCVVPPVRMFSPHGIEQQRVRKGRAHGKPSLCALRLRILAVLHVFCIYVSLALEAPQVPTSHHSQEMGDRVK